MAEIVFPEHSLRVVEGTPPVKRDRVSVEDYEKGTHIALAKRIDFLEGQIAECEGRIAVGSGELDTYRMLAKLQGELISRLQEFTEVKKSVVANVEVSFVEVDLKEFER